jgi:copper oxidase (laccase) domain-containing protein
MAGLEYIHFSILGFTKIAKCNVCTFYEQNFSKTRHDDTTGYRVDSAIPLEQINYTKKILRSI